jgi:hypothetical protein
MSEKVKCSHMAWDIKPYGVCPSCDAYMAKIEREWAIDLEKERTSEAQKTRHIP